jgi:hypothetical protein
MFKQYEFKLQEWWRVLVSGSCHWLAFIHDTHLSLTGIHPWHAPVIDWHLSMTRTRDKEPSDCPMTWYLRNNCRNFPKIYQMNLGEVAGQFALSTFQKKIVIIIKSFNSDSLQRLWSCLYRVNINVSNCGLYITQYKYERSLWKKGDTHCHSLIVIVSFS